MEKYREITQKVIDGYKDLGLVIEERNEDLDIDATVRRISEALRGKIYFSPADGGTDGILQPQRFVFRGMDVTMDFNSVAHGTLLGFVHIKGNRIPMIFVEEGARQSGIGSLLLITALREIKAAGFSEASLRSMNDKIL